MTRYLQIINIRTFVVLIICLVTSFYVIHFDIRYNLDLTIMSIAIIFPLVFTIRAAFRRREKALDHLSRFKAALLIVYGCFDRCKKLSDEKKALMKEKLLAISESMVSYLMIGKNDQVELRAHLRFVFDFIQSNKEEISSSEAFKILRFMKDVNTGVENTIAIYTHNTPISLRAYCLIFIYVFPFIYSPALLHRLDSSSPDWVVYSLSIVTGFILISLFNVQDQMENPFDQDGLDDIRVKDFKLEL
ncbi:MAG: hypothetical protein SH819_14265 [Cytophagales bacterium]|nr:hypothetical protein [Cytophagales bacterium]